MSQQRIGFLFPGQGSQTVGMGKDACEKNAAAGEFFDRADSLLGYKLSDICRDGPEETLRQTENTQPALFVTSAATLELLRREGIKPFAVAGHSLGEYSALYAAGVFDFETGLKLVRSRGKAFAEAGAANNGAMAAILGLATERVREICGAMMLEGKTVVAANINEPNQTVISGERRAVEEACETLKAAGAKRALMLPVGGAFHSPLVAPAAEVMHDALAAVEFKKPNCLFVNNVDACPLDDLDCIKQSLVNQVTGSVRWVESIQQLVKAGVTAFVEVGSGKVLSGLVKKIAPDVPCYTTESLAAIDATVEKLKG
ncbi:ACP S-malonyltransferase [soil metagenome]